MSTPCISLKNISAFNRYYGSFEDLNGDLIREQVDVMSKSIRKLIKTLGTNLQAKRIADQVRLKIDKFKVILPILDSICREGMTDRHWGMISDELGQPCNPLLYPTLCHMIDIDIGRIATRLEQISNAAGNEFELNLQLSNMKAEWKDVSFELMNYR